MVTTVESVIKFPYKRSLGPVLGAFMTGLTEQRFVGIRNGGKVLCPPLEWDPETGTELAHDFVDVGPAGTVESWTWVAKPTEQHPLDKPFAMALVKLDGADTTLVHAVDAGSIDKMSTGMRVAPRWRAERKGHITDIEAFVPGEEPQGGGGTKTRFEMLLSPKEHEMHHRAQLMTIQRMIGQVPHLTRQMQERMAQMQQQAQTAGQR